MRDGVVAAAIAACVLGAAAAPARADVPKWEAGIGVAALELPHYRGSDQSRAWLLPLPYFVYRGDVLKADREGARALLLQSARVDFDISAAAAAPTHSHDNTARSGMPDLKPMAELGPSAKVVLLRSGDLSMDLRVPLRAAFTLESKPRHVGWTLSPHLAVDLRRGGWDLGVYTGPVLADRRYLATFYDVPAAYATPTRPAYRTGGGRAGWQFVAGASRRVGDLWLGAYAKLDDVSGAAFDGSPLVRRRSTVSYGIGLSWVFAHSAERVSE